MDKISKPENTNVPSHLTDDFAGLTFGSVLSALSNGSPAGVETRSSLSSSAIIADKTLQLERRLREAEAEISSLKNVNQLQKDRIDSLESELHARKHCSVGEKKSDKTAILKPNKIDSSLRINANPPSSIYANSPGNNHVNHATFPGNNHVNHDNNHVNHANSHVNHASNPPYSDDFALDMQSYYETRCRNLEKMVLEMHRWFSDYDLVWVGEKEGDEDHALKELTDEQLREFETRNAGLNLETLINSFPNGDEVVDDDIDDDVDDDDDDDSTPSLDVFWFANGLKISSYPLMRYDDETWGRQTLEEIAEGFLPSRLQFDFPHGVDLKSKDRRRFVFDDTKEREYPSVRELRARGLLPSADHPGLEEKRGRGKDVGGKGSFKPSVWSHGSRVRPKSPASRYLEKVPKMVIDKDGDIRRPREGLEKMLAGRSEASTKPRLSSRVIPVRIRVYHRQDDEQLLRVHLRTHQTIDELKRICEKKLRMVEGAFDESFEMVSDVEMRQYEMSEEELNSSSLIVWQGGMVAVGDAGWLREGVDDDAPIRDKLICLHIRRKV